MVEQDFQTCFKTLATMIGADNVENNDNIMVVYDYFIIFIFYLFFIFCKVQVPHTTEEVTSKSHFNI